MKFSLIRLFLSLCAASILVACGGGGGESVATPAVSSKVVFTNVSDVVGTQKAVVGQIDVTIAKVKRSNVGGAIQAVSKLVFENVSPTVVVDGVSYPYQLKPLFSPKGIMLYDEDGDMAGRIPYTVLFEDKRVTVIFEGSGYYGRQGDEILALRADISNQATFFPKNLALSLVHVEYVNHTFSGELVANSAITTGITWIALPTLDTGWSKNQYIISVPQSVMAAQIFVSCPTDGVVAVTCILDQIEVTSVGGKDFQIGDGYRTINSKVDGDVSSFGTNWSVGSGMSSHITLLSTARDNIVVTDITKMIFDLGGVKVAPIVMIGSMTCTSVLESLARSYCPY